MDRKETQLLRGICEDLRNFVMPQLSGDAAERALFMIRTLRRMASEGDVYPQLSAQAERGFRDALVTAGTEAPALAPTLPTAARIREWRSAMVETLIDAGADIEGDRLRAMERIGEADRMWCEERSRAEAAITEAAAEQAQDTVYDRVTPATVTGYLCDHFPNDPDIVCTAVRVLPGGRSKKTIMVTVAGTSRFPTEMVMRQEDSDHLNTALADEYPVLASLAEADIGLPIPDPLHYEPDANPLGGPFLLMRRLPGAQLGDYTGFDRASPTTMDDLARALAAIHAVPVGHIRINDPDQGASQEERMQRKLAGALRQWRDNTVEPSPLIEYTFSWLQRECRHGLHPPVLVHGDVRPHNLMGEHDRLTGILDWELTHLGDPAEDLAYLRPTVQAIGLWDRFLAVYQEAGGTHFDERSYRIYGAWGLVRNSSFGARSSRLHLNREDRDFTRGAVGYYSIPMLEAQLAQALKGAIGS